MTRRLSEVGRTRAISGFAVFATVAIVSIVGPAHAEEVSYGRLFFTPEQRARLDQGRLDALAALNRPAAPVAAPMPKAAPPKVVTLQGVVKRSDGESTVWVNGKAVSGRSGESEVHSGSVTRDSVGIDVPGARRRVRLKVGQSLEATSGTIEEGYRRRRTLPSAAVPVEPPPESVDEPAADPMLRPPARRGGGAAGESSDARSDDDS